MPTFHGTALGKPFPSTNASDPYRLLQKLFPTKLVDSPPAGEEYRMWIQLPAPSSGETIWFDVGLNTLKTDVYRAILAIWDGNGELHTMIQRRPTTKKWKNQTNGPPPRWSHNAQLLLQNNLAPDDDQDIDDDISSSLSYSSFDSDEDELVMDQVIGDSASFYFNSKKNHHGSLALFHDNDNHSQRDAGWKGHSSTDSCSSYSSSSYISSCSSSYCRSERNNDDRYGLDMDHVTLAPDSSSSNNKTVIHLRFPKKENGCVTSFDSFEVDLESLISSINLQTSQDVPTDIVLHDFVGCNGETKTIHLSAQVWIGSLLAHQPESTELYQVFATSDIPLTRAKQLQELKEMDRLYCRVRHWIAEMIDFEAAIVRRPVRPDEMGGFAATSSPYYFTDAETEFLDNYWLVHNEGEKGRLLITMWDLFHAPVHVLDYLCRDCTFPQLVMRIFDLEPDFNKCPTFEQERMLWINAKTGNASR